VKTLNRNLLFMLLSALSACGQQLVEFKDAGTSDGARVDTANPDAAKMDGARIDTASSDADATSNDLGRADAADADASRADSADSADSANNADSADSADRDAARDAAVDQAIDVPVDQAVDVPVDQAIDVSIDLSVDGPDGSNIGAPFVTFTDPGRGDSGVVLTKKISATFSEAMNPTTLNKSTFTLKQGNVAIGGSVSYIGITATFSPSTNLASNSTFVATISAGAKDVAGNALASPYTWTFMTGAILDATAPTVVLTSPVDLATAVPLGATLTATFSEPMNPTSVNAVTFTLKAGNLLIPGTVTYVAAGTTALFIPATRLAPNTTYTATITTGATDSSGNPLASNFVWTFTTSACGQAPVVLGAADDFVVLAGSTVTNTGATTVTGDLGVSPGTAVTGFPPGKVVGAQHAGDTTSAQAVADLTTAYNDAAGRTLCPVTIAGNLGGLTLPPGLYKSTSSLEISSGDLTLDAQGDGDAVFIFQMASTLTTTSGRQVILSGGAQSTNVFWQVGTSATLGSTSAFQGTIMADQAITLETGATLNGRALARIAAVNLDSNMIVKPTP